MPFHFLYAVLLVVGLVLAASTHAQTSNLKNTFSLYGGWRVSSGFEQGDSNASGNGSTVITPSSIKVRNASAASVSFDRAVDASRQVQLMVSRQNTRLTIQNLSAAGATPVTQLPLSLTYLQLGGTNFFESTVNNGPYVAAGLGLTFLSPGLDGFSSETRPSLSAALGYALPLWGDGSALALRLEARGWFTFLNSRGSLFCDGGCRLNIRGDTLQQGEVMLGLSVQF